MSEGTAPPLLGLGHFTFLDLPPQELVRLAARTGYSAVGLRLHPAAPGGLAYVLPPGSREMREMQAVLRDKGVSVYDIETVVVNAAFDPEALKPVFASSAELGAKRLNICADDPDRGRLVANYAQLCELAADHGMGVDVECMKWRVIDTLGKCVEIVEASGMANAGVLVDALHLARCGGTPDDVAKIPPHLIPSAQLCDAPAAAPVGTEATVAEARAGRLPPGRGGLPLKALIAALPEQVIYSVEIPMAGKEAPDVRAKTILDATMALFA